MSEILCGVPLCGVCRQSLERRWREIDRAALIGCAQRALDAEVGECEEEEERQAGDSESLPHDARDGALHERHLMRARCAATFTTALDRGPTRRDAAPERKARGGSARAL